MLLLKNTSFARNPIMNPYLFNGGLDTIWTSHIIFDYSKKYKIQMRGVYK